jgi:RimJ/RimL family protein N-acetyltransferase
VKPEARPVPVFDTPRLRLRPLADGDAAFILELLNEPGWLRHIGDRGVRDLADARRYIEEGPAAMLARHGLGLLAVTLKEGGTPVGICGLLQRDSLPAPDLGFALLARHGGRGYGREAAEATLAWGQAAFGLSRILAITFADNPRSIRLLTALGFAYLQNLRLPGDDRDSALYAWEAP